MTGRAGDDTIELSRWYGRVVLDPRDRPSAPPDSPDVRQIGALTVFLPDQGCEIAVFGSHAQSAVVFDGYLFDRANLSAELGASTDATTADLVALAYQRWGADAFDRLDGRYLVAIWEEHAGQFLLGHDGLGRHPAFYSPERDACWFASNVLALAESGRVPTRPNRLSLALSLVRYWPEAGETFFEAIRRVRPGHYLAMRPGAGVTEHKYFDPLPADDEPWLPERQVIEEFEPALMRAVSRCMDLGAQGIMLSGGVDSVTIAALAAEHGKARGQPPLVAVSGRTGEALSGEERMQTLVAGALGMPHDISTLPEWRQGQDDVSLSLAMARELPAPTHMHWVGTYTRFYRRTVDRGLHVLLTGSGGDDWLGVSGAWAADLIGTLNVVGLAQFIKTDVATAGQSLPASLRFLLWKSGVRLYVDSWWALVAPAHKARFHDQRWRQNLPDWICPDDRLREDLIEHLLARRTPSLTNAGRIPRSRYRHALHSVANSYIHHENETAYHLESACGLRLLSPYHDRRLVSFFNRIAPRTLVHGNRYKGLLRPVVAKHLPGLGLESQRKDVGDNLREEMDDVRSGIAKAWPNHRFNALGALGVVDAHRLRQGSGRLERIGGTGLMRMFAAMSAERWIGVHGGA